MPIVVNCAGDTQLAERLYAFLKLEFPSTSVDIDEITVNTVDSQDKEAVRKLLAQFLASNSDLTHHSITELGDLFTLGIAQIIDKLVMRCEMCNYLAHDEDEMIIHKRVHGILGL